MTDLNLDELKAKAKGGFITKDEILALISCIERLDALYDQACGKWAEDKAKLSRAEEMITTFERLKFNRGVCTFPRPLQSGAYLPCAVCHACRFNTFLDALAAWREGK